MPNDSEQAAAGTQPANPQLTGVRRLVGATVWSMAGLRSAFAGEEAFRQELMICLVLAPLGLWLGETAIERALLVGCLLLVLIVELLNTGIESVVDRVGADHHSLSKRAKDVGSAAVFLSLLTVIFVWSILLL
jgi:diacylglycerol kinase (ATP)